MVREPHHHLEEDGLSYWSMAMLDVCLREGEKSIREGEGRRAEPWHRHSPGWNIDEQLHGVGLLDEQVRSRRGSFRRHGSPTPLLSSRDSSGRRRIRGGAERILSIVEVATTVIIAVGHHGPAARLSSARNEGGRADLTAA